MFHKPDAASLRETVFWVNFGNHNFRFFGRIKTDNFFLVQKILSLGFYEEGMTIT